MKINVLYKHKSVMSSTY